MWAARLDDASRRRAAGIIPAMTERGLPPVDGSPACPFVAFDDDRDARADEPDHRHRCFAEPQPAPRALAHQEAYCLSSAFPVCPTFQAWARREAARARPPSVRPAAAPPDEEDRAAGRASDAGPADEWAVAPSAPDVPIEMTPRRNPPRDWAAPPPWATGAGAAGAGGRGGGRQAGTGGDERGRAAGAPEFLTSRSEGAGLAGSAADRLSAGGSLTDADAPVRPARSADGLGAGSSGSSGPAGPAARPHDLPSAGPDPELAGLVGRGGRGGATWSRDEAADDDRPTHPPPPRSARRPSVSSTRSGDRDRDRGRERLPAHEHVQQQEGPSWERARRYEAYPTLRSRSALGMPALPRVAVLAGALAVAALALFFLPALLGVGGDDEPGATPSASLAPATPTPSPTPEPEPTPQVYVIQEGDTLYKIAREFGITLDDLLAANQETITDPDRISVGDQIIIPVPVPEQVDGGGSEESVAP